jgi:hypothetical protein
MTDYSEEIDRTREYFSVRFPMKELRELKHFLGLEVERTKEGLDSRNMPRIFYRGMGYFTANLSPHLWIQM